MYFGFRRAYLLVKRFKCLINHFINTHLLSCIFLNPSHLLCSLILRRSRSIVATHCGRKQPGPSENQAIYSRPVVRLKQLTGLSKMVKQNYHPHPPPPPHCHNAFWSLRCKENIKKKLVDLVSKTTVLHLDHTSS